MTQCFIYLMNFQCHCRFVELLWQLSLHALREVHRRTFASDVASNPLPASLTDVAFQHAATLLPVTKVIQIFCSVLTYVNKSKASQVNGMGCSRFDIEIV